MGRMGGGTVRRVSYAARVIPPLLAPAHRCRVCRAPSTIQHYDGCPEAADPAPGLRLTGCQGAAATRDAHHAAADERAPEEFAVLARAI